MRYEAKVHVRCWRTRNTITIERTDAPEEWEGTYGGHRQLFSSRRIAVQWAIGVVAS